MPPTFLSPVQLRQLQDDGSVFLPRWHNARTTYEIGCLVGHVIDIDTLLPEGGIPTVQTLQPRTTSEASNNRYSGVFGLDEFPLHTDLAHWAKPPRYLMLRCKRGAANVATTLLPASAVERTVGQTDLRRALVKPRRPSRSGRTSLLTLSFFANDIFGLRWDSLFLTPVNPTADRVIREVAGSGKQWPEIRSIFLRSPGDTVLIDNWRMLHGRGRVTPGSTRIIERLYLSEIHYGPGY